MTQQLSRDEEAVLRVVGSWPREQQIQFAHRLLDPGVGTRDPHTGRPRLASAALRGISAGGLPAPTDADIERWRLGKHDT